MDKCKKCSNKFKWKTIIKPTWLNSYSPVICDSCKSVHYPTKRTCNIIRSVLIMPIFLIAILTKNIGYYSLIVYILWIALMIGITPVFAKFYIKNEMV